MPATRTLRHAAAALLPLGMLAALAAPATSTVSAAAAPSAAADTHKPGPRVPTIDWAPCGDDFPGIECATADVPLDYDHPRGRTTTLALARVPATDTAHRIGSVFVNPGGPGGSGVGLVLFGFGEFLRDRLDGRFDVVGFDPRGVAGSDPLHCFDSEDDLNAFFGEVPVFPYLDDQFRPFFDRYAALGDQCLGRGEEIARHMSTADVARDMDLLRRAVGDRTMTYLGFSYGSFLGSTYANLFPKRVRALVIDGVLEPRLWAGGEHIRIDRLATQEEFEEFLRLCDEAGDACAFSVPGGSAARWDALAEALEAEPLELPDGSLYTYDFLIGDATGFMYSPEVWGGDEGAGAYLDAIANAVLGDRAAARRAVEIRRALVDRLRPAAAEADYDNGLDAYFGNQCSDTQYPSSFGAFRRIGEFARAGSRFGPLWWWFNNGCADWPTAPDRYGGPWTVRTAAPVLVVGNLFDGVTGYDGAVGTNRALRGSRLLTYAGWGHTAYGRSECTSDYIDAYLLDGSLPPAGTVCPANPNPFSGAAARRAAASGPILVGLPPSWLLSR